MQSWIWKALTRHILSDSGYWLYLIRALAVSGLSQAEEKLADSQAQTSGSTIYPKEIEPTLAVEQLTLEVESWDLDLILLMNEDLSDLGPAWILSVM